MAEMGTVKQRMAANSRKMFEQAWHELSEAEQNEIREAAKQTWLAAFNATKLVRAYCPKCEGKVQIEFPDTLNQAKTLEILSTLSFGEQPKVVHHEVDHGKLTLEVIRWTLKSGSGASRSLRIRTILEVSWSIHATP